MQFKPATHTAVPDPPFSWVSLPQTWTRLNQETRAWAVCKPMAGKARQCSDDPSKDRFLPSGNIHPNIFDLIQMYKRPGRLSIQESFKACKTRNMYWGGFQIDNQTEPSFNFAEEESRKSVTSSDKHGDKCEESRFGGVNQRVIQTNGGKRSCNWQNHCFPSGSVLLQTKHMQL